MKKWLYFSTLIMAVLISIIISNSNLTLASEESNEVNLTREFLQEATAYEENGIVVLKRERAVSTQSIQSEHIQDVVWLQKSGGKAHGFNRGMKAKKLFAIIGQ